MTALRRPAPARPSRPAAALLGARLVRDDATRPAGRADRRGRGVHRRGRPGVARPVRADRPERGHVRASRDGLRVPCLRHVRLPERRHRARRTARPRSSSGRSSRSRVSTRCGPIAPAGRASDAAAPPAAATGPAAPATRARTAASARGPGLVCAILDLDRADRRRPARRRIAAVRLEPRPLDEPAPAVVASPRVGIGYAGEPWTRLPWRLSIAGHPVGLRARRPLVAADAMDARSVALLEFPLVRERLAEKTSFPPSRRLAEALVPESDPVLVDPRPRRDRPGPRAARRSGPASGSAPRTTSGRRSSGRPAAAAWTRQQFLELADTLDATARLQTVARRRPPAAAPRPRPASCIRCRRSARRSPAASTRPASCSTPPRRGSAGCGRPSASPTTGCGAVSTRSSARSSAARSRTRSSRSATAATSSRSRPRPGRGSRASSTTRPAAARRCSSSRSSPSSSGNAWREAQVAEQEEIERILDELSALVAANAVAAARDARGARPVRLLGRQGAVSPPTWTATRAETADAAGGHPPQRPPPGPDRPGRSRSTSAWATATRRSS